MCKKKELELSYFSTCERKNLDVKISELIALKAGSTLYPSAREYQISMVILVWGSLRSTIYWITVFKNHRIFRVPAYTENYRESSEGKLPF